MKRREDALATSVAPIPLCVFVPLCEILFVSIRGPYSRPFAVALLPCPHLLQTASGEKAPAKTC